MKIPSKVYKMIIMHKEISNQIAIVFDFILKKVDIMNVFFG
jgi:hypothetical protein